MKFSTNRILAFWSKGLYSLVLLIALSFHGFSQGVAINATGNPPNASAGLDVDFPDKGLLIPRVALTGSASASPLPSHVSGMMVYNTATAGDVTPGFYYDNGAKWIPSIPAGNAAGDMLFWNGSGWVVIPAGTIGQLLQSNGASMPTWVVGGTPFPMATLTTTAATLITGTTATSGGNISADGGLTVLARGVCYSTTPFPTTANSKVVDASGGIGAFVSNLAGLSPVTTYYIRAYATNSAVTAYGSQVNFTTSAVLPTLTTTAASAITGTTANSGGNVLTTGGSGIIERGICYATSANPTTANTKIIDPAPGTGLFVSNLTGLSGSTTYHVRAYAINGVGIAYGNDISFTTLMVLPVITTTAATNIAATSATSGGSYVLNGGGFSYGNSGVAYSLVSNSPAPTFVSNGFSVSAPPNPFVTNINGLAGGTTYYIRAYIDIYNQGWSTIFGNELTFTTAAPTAPIVSATSAITLISGNSARSGGTITSDGGSGITAKGVCWSTSPTPVLGTNNFTTDGTGTNSYQSNITGLTGSTLYYVRAYATNPIGTSYGPVDVSFTTWTGAPYNVGQDVGGYGICVYTDQNGNGFIVSYDIPFTGQWGCSGTSIATSAALGAGSANTDLIMANCVTRPIAASVAKTYNGGGYLDWYLPSSGDWAQILVGAQSNLYYHQTNNFYTSTQQNATYAVSYFFNFNSGYQSGAAKTPGVNDYVFYIRAARSFSTADATTNAASNITNSSATTGGNIISNGGPAITARGVCWSTSAAPTLTNPHTTDGSGSGPFVSNITSLLPNTTYHVRAYATIGSTVYGNEITFTTLP